MKPLPHLVSMVTITISIIITSTIVVTSSPLPLTSQNVTLSSTSVNLRVLRTEEKTVYADEDDEIEIANNNNNNNNNSNNNNNNNNNNDDDDDGGNNDEGIANDNYDANGDYDVINGEYNHDAVIGDGGEYGNEIDNIIGDDADVTFDNTDPSHSDRRSAVRILRHEIVSGGHGGPDDDDGGDGGRGDGYDSDGEHDYKDGDDDDGNDDKDGDDDDYYYDDHESSRTLQHAEVHSEITKHEISHKKELVYADDGEAGDGGDKGDDDDDDDDNDDDDDGIDLIKTKALDKNSIERSFKGDNNFTYTTKRDYKLYCNNNDSNNNNNNNNYNNNNNNRTNNSINIGATNALLGDQGKFVNRSNKSREKVESDDGGDDDDDDDDDDVDNRYSTPQQRLSEIFISSSSSSTSSSSPSDDIPIKRMPQAIIIGVKKGGTRALLEFLQLHPRVRAPGPEVHFFDKHYAKGLDWYRQQMPLTISDQITIEKTPSYFVTRDAPVRVHSMSPGVKLIIVVRNPVTRAISDYAQARSKKNDLLTFEELVFQRHGNKVGGVALIKTSRQLTTGLIGDAAAATNEIPSNTTNTDRTNNKTNHKRTTKPTISPHNVTDSSAIATSWGAIRIGLYAKHLERWLAYFPKSQIHFVHGERLVVDPAGELALLQDFLGLERFITDRFFYFDAVKGFPCLRVRPNSSYSWPSYDQDLRSSITSDKQSLILSRVTSASSDEESQNFTSKESYKHLLSIPEADKLGHEHESIESESPATNLPKDFIPKTSSTTSIALNSPSDQPRTHCLGKTKGRAHPAVSQSIMDSMRRFYRPYNERFYRMTGTNFGWS